MKDERTLRAGMDFRRPEYRREVFMRFYEFHLRWAAHPGAVYYAIPQLFERVKIQDGERRLWALYINGCTQNIVTTYLILKQFPELERVNGDDLKQFIDDQWYKLQWDTDRRYTKAKFPDMVENYRKVVNGDQTAYFRQLMRDDDVYANFRRTWRAVLNDFYCFGRLATFSYLEYLRIGGWPIDCDNLFLDDISGSKSHRNGICKVYGRDDLDWTKDNHVKYSLSDLLWTKRKGAELLSEAKGRINHPDVSYFTLESTLCCYKGWHRVNRRYPNVYNDMFADRIRWSQRRMKDPDLQLFWDIRRECLPIYLRIEDNPRDVGLNPIKQNHYLFTGEVIMMNRDWDCFANSYNEWIEAKSDNDWNDWSTA